jgi:hypothetical protein
MRIATHRWRTFGAMLLVLAPWLLLPLVIKAPSAFRGPAPANTLRRTLPQPLLKQEMFGINPDRLILYNTPLPAYVGVPQIPQR